MAAPDQRTSIQEKFDRSHAIHARSATLRRIWRDAYGDEYPEEASPNGFIPRSILRRLADELRVGPGETLVDLGCGHGGPAFGPRSRAERISSASTFPRSAWRWRGSARPRSGWTRAPSSGSATCARPACRMAGSTRR